MFQWKASDFVLVEKKLKFYLFGKTFVADFVLNVFMTNVPNVLVQAASNHAFKISILYCFDLKDCTKWTIWGQLKVFNNPLQLLLHCVRDKVANLKQPFFFVYCVKMNRIFFLLSQFSSRSRYSCKVYSLKPFLSLFRPRAWKLKNSAGIRVLYCLAVEMIHMILMLRILMSN